MAEEFMAALEGRISYLANVLQTTVVDFAPVHLKGYIDVKVTELTTRFVITVKVRNENPQQKYGTSDAAAQEYGMGDKNVQGDSTFYGHIYPVNGTYLVFMGTHDYEGQLIFTRAVTRHPGSPPFENRGYVGPAIREFAKTVLPSIDPDIHSAVGISIRKSFPGAKK